MHYFAQFVALIVKRRSQYVRFTYRFEPVASPFLYSATYIRCVSDWDIPRTYQNKYPRHLLIWSDWDKSQIRLVRMFLVHRLNVLFLQ